MYDIISVGSATRDIFVWTDAKLKKGMFCYPVGEKILANDIDFHSGGGGTNTAVSFALKGLKTAYLGMLGRDSNGIYIRTLLHAFGVDFIGSIGKEMTGVSIILDSKTKKDRTILAYKGVNNQLKFSQINLSKLKTKWFYFCAMEGESFKTLEKLADYAKRKKIKVMFNPSSYLAKEGMSHLKRIISATDILVLNKEEAEYLAGRGSINELLKKLQRHVKIVIITDGSNGAYAYNGIQKYFIKRKVRVVEATGAGDAFGSGFLAGVILKKDIEFAMKLAQANAESVLKYVGAKDNLLGANEIKKAIKGLRVKIEKL